MIVKVLLLILFFAVMVGIGFYSRKHATNVDGFVLGGRSVGPWLTAFAYGTSYFSAVVFVGYAGQFGYKYGISATWIGIGNALIGSLLAWIVLGRRTRIMSKHLKAKTMPDYFADYDTIVHFISQEELDRDHGTIPHGGFVIRSGHTGGGETQVVEYSLKLDSNPAFTSSVLVAYARAAYRLAQKQEYGAKTVLDIAPALLSPKGGAPLRKELV